MENYKLSLDTSIGFTSSLRMKVAIVYSQIILKRFRYIGPNPLMVSGHGLINFENKTSALKSSGVLEETVPHFIIPWGTL